MMYGKIFASMFKGSLYGQWEAIVTFTVMIVLADSEGEVDMTQEALSAATSIPLDIIRKGIASLEAPDANSRTPDEEGRRIVRVSEKRDWGWTITNHAHYRAIRTAEERREYFKQHKRKQRAAAKSTQSTTTQLSPPLSTASPQSPPIAVSSMQYADTEARTAKALHDARFSEDAHRTAYRQVRARARNPAAFDAMLATLVVPIAGGPSFSWLTVGQAMLEMQTSEAAPSAAAIRAYCRRLKDSPLGRKGGATGDGIDWTVPIEDKPLFGAR